jgi:integrase
MAVSKEWIPCKDGSFSLQVRVGKLSAEWFNTKSYGSSKKATREAAERRNLELKALSRGAGIVKAITCRELSDQFLADLERRPMKNGRRRKRSTIDQARTSARGFNQVWGDRLVSDVRREEAYRWAVDASAGHVAWAIQLFNHAVDDLELRPSNPFKGLKPRVVGRAHEAPPTLEEFGRILEACDVLGEKYGSTSGPS